MKVFFATDHAGLELKNELARYVHDELGHEVEDFGAYDMNPEDDYPDFISRAANAVSKNVDPDNARAIILGGTGQGEAMVANRFPHVRAAVYYGGPRSIVMLAREHNNANVLALGARFIDKEEARSAVHEWLSTAFSGDERHRRRIGKIEQITDDLK